MYAFVKVTGGPGRAFEKHCQELGEDPAKMIEAMILSFVAAKNFKYPPAKERGDGLDKFTSTYLDMRDTRLALQKQAEKECEKIKEQEREIENHLLKQLNDQGAKSMRTESATFYKEKVFRPSISDDAAFYDFIREDEDGFRFLERRVTKKAVEDYMKETGNPPPGISTYTEYEVRVRRGKDN